MIFRLGCLDSVYKVCLDDHAPSGSRIFAIFSLSFSPLVIFFELILSHNGPIWSYFGIPNWSCFWYFFCWVLDFFYFNNARCSRTILLGMPYRAQSHTEIFIYNACLTKIPLCAVIDLKYLWQYGTIRNDTLRDMVGQGLNWHFGCQMTQQPRSPTAISYQV